MMRFIANLKKLHAAYRAAPAGSVRKRLRHLAAHKIYLPNRARLAASLNRLDAVLGPHLVNRLYWYAPLPKPWFITETRVLHLVRLRDQALSADREELARRPLRVLEDFARLALRRSSDPITLSSLARSDHSGPTLFAALDLLVLGRRRQLARRIARNLPLAYAMAALARLHPDRSKGDALHALVAAHAETSGEKFTSFLASFGYCPAQGSLAARRPARHRLVILANAGDKLSISLLFDGAEKITLYSYEDLLGRADFSGERLHASAKNLSVEHARSRITRFSAEYHRLHQDTRQAAAVVANRLNRLSPRAPLLKENRPFAEMVFADYLFFSALRTAAIEKLLESPEFDHVVIAMQDGPAAANFLGTLAAVPAVATDHRIEVVSLSRTLARRTQFLQTWAGTQLIKRVKPRPPIPPANVAAALDTVKSYCTTRLADFPTWAEAAGDRVLMLVAPVSAYNASSAQYLDILNKGFDLQALHMGGTGALFTNPLPAAEGAALAPRLHRLAITSRPNSNALVDVLRWAPVNALGSISSPLVRRLLYLNNKSFVENVLLPYLTFYESARQWIALLKAQDRLPKVIVMSPARTMFVSSFVALARQEQIPTIALEPHGLNASYCRYSTIYADYYGVITSFFQGEAADGFEIPAERCPVVGSPRLIAPQDYDVQAARLAARAQLAESCGVQFDGYAASFTFMSQPSDWDQMSDVWRIILRATAGLNIQILLKCHPEETVTRARAFLALAAQEGASERVRQIIIDPKTAIEASDMLLSGYSATVVEAALLRHPVACIINGDNSYPLDQHRVVGAPLWRSVEEMRAGVTAFLADPSPYLASANRFLEKEPQLLSGTAPYVRALVEKVMALPPAEAIRAQDDLPQSCFLRGPFQVYKV
jgi:hypothetical protein